MTKILTLEGVTSSLVLFKLVLMLLLVVLLAKTIFPAEGS